MPFEIVNVAESNPIPRGLQRIAPTKSSLTTHLFGGVLLSILFRKATADRSFLELRLAAADDSVAVVGRRLLRREQNRSSCPLLNIEATRSQSARHFQRNKAGACRVLVRRLRVDATSVAPPSMPQDSRFGCRCHAPKGESSQSYQSDGEPHADQLPPVTGSPGGFQRAPHA